MILETDPVHWFQVKHVSLRTPLCYHIRSLKLRTQPISLNTRFWLKTEVKLQFLVVRMLVNPYRLKDPGKLKVTDVNG